MGRRYLLLEDKHLFNQHCGDQWEITGKDNKLCLREFTKARKCSKLSRDIETGGGCLYTDTEGVEITQHRETLVSEIQNLNINLGGETQM